MNEAIKIIFVSSRESRSLRVRVPMEQQEAEADQQ